MYASYAGKGEEKLDYSKIFTFVFLSLSLLTEIKNLPIHMYVCIISEMIVQI